jgi:hypothetical protein
MTDLSDMFLFIDAKQVMILNICPSSCSPRRVAGVQPVMCFLLAVAGSSSRC